MVAPYLGVNSRAEWGILQGNNRRSSASTEKSEFTERSSFDSCKSFDDEKHIRKLRISQTDASNTSFKSISHEDHRHHKFYKPTATKSWSLTIFLLVIGICIVLLELSIQFHPDASTVSDIRARNARLDKRQPLQPREQELNRMVVERRQDEQSLQTTTSISVSSSETGSVSTSIVDATTSSVVVGEPNPNDQLTIITKSSSIDSGGLTGAPNPASQLSVTTQPTTSSTAITVGEPAPESQLSITRPSSSSTVFASPAPDSQLSITRQSSSSILIASPTPDSRLSSNDAEGGSANRVATLLDSSIISSSSALSAAPRPTDASTHAHDVVNSDGQSSVVSDSSRSLVAITLTNENGQATATVLSGSTSQGIQIDSIETDRSSVASATLATQTVDARPTSSVPSGSNGTTSALYKEKTFTQFDYFLAMYLPNVISVVLQSSWLVVFASFKMMEPFYQLSQPGGAPSKSTLTADYLSSGISVSFAKVALDNHWVLALAGIVQLALALTVLMDAGAFSVVPTAYCKTAISDHQPCDPKWVVNVSLVRAVEVFLIVCFSLIISIIVLHRKRETGVYTDPSKIATVADILVHKPLIQELRDIPPSATKGEISLDLQESRYALGTFIQDGRSHYGIVKLERQPNSMLMISEPWYSKGPRRLGLWWESKAGHLAEMSPYFTDCLCLALVISLFAIILTYRLLPSPTIDNSSFNEWMSSGDSSPRIVLSALACAVSFFIKNKERTLRLSYPYILMSKGPQPATESITSGTQATAFTSLFKAFRGMDISLALMAVSVIFVDIVLILIPGIPQTAAQTAPVYLSSTYVCLFMLAVIFIAHARVTFKEWRRGHQIECPDTLAAVLLRLCASHFVEEKNSNEAHGTIEFGHDDHEKQHARYDGADGERRYRFGVMEGVDGVQRYMVDEDVWARRRKEYQL